MASNWIHRLFNPHCEHCQEEREDSKVCESCETLRRQLEISNFDKNKLLDRLLEKPGPESKPELREVTRPQSIPWAIRRQMLEREDREKAKLMAQAPQPIPTEELEKELDVAAATREAESKH